LGPSSGRITFLRYTGSVRRLSRDRILFSTYAALLLLTVLIVPLKIPEILQLSAGRHFDSPSIVRWVAQAPGSTPLNYFVQLPFVAVLGHSRFGARVDSLLFALGSCYFFLRLAKRVPLQHPYLALGVFMLLPAHFQVAYEGRPFEQALFLLLLATEWFFRLWEHPTVRASVIYAGLLTLCLYSDRYAYMPAFGYLAFLFRFVNRAQERRAVWFALPATVLPMLLFLPYFLWAQPQVSPYWLTGFPVAGGLSSPDHLEQLAGNDWIAFVLTPMLLGGMIAGAWSSLRPSTGAISKRILLFCLFGGIVSVLAAAMIADLWLGDSFSSSQILWAAPAMVVLVFVALEWLEKQRFVGALAAPLAVLLILLCASEDYLHLNWNSRAGDQQMLTSLVLPELTGDSCVVFVSQNFSKALFAVFQPDLENRECLNFFHHRVVLASHAYVRAAQQRDAETFFRGLNYVERKRIRAGGGQIVAMDQSQ
jgi:hypothetical protein